MTLIELMVVVVILVTLVGGVLPLVSPNNDARKIAEASRGLQTYFMQAQAEAARIGRPVGVGFRETAAGSGIALEMFQLTVPKPYFGSSSTSRVGVQPLTAIVGGVEVPDTYGGSNTPPQIDNTLKYEQYRGAQLYAIDSKMALKDTDGNKIADPLPPKMFRVGDRILAQGNEFLIVDDVRGREVIEEGSLTKFVNPATNYDLKDIHKLFCIRLADVLMGSDAQPLSVPPNGYSYGIYRQPMADSATRMNSAEAPFQLPSGVAIDLMGSGLEADGMGLFGEAVPLKDSDGNQYSRSVGIMFSPNGGIESVWLNGVKTTTISRLFLLIGRAENGVAYVNPIAVPLPGPAVWNISRTASDEEFKQFQGRINWLNLDSKWLMVNGNDGRLTVHSNGLVNARLADYVGKTDEETLRLQIEAAHALAHQHSDGGARK